MYDYTSELNGDLAFLMADAMDEIRDYLNYEADMESMNSEPSEADILAMAEHYGEA